MSEPKLPPQATQDDSVRTHIRESIVYGLKNTVKKDEGYFNDLGDVCDEFKTLEQLKNFPAINVVTGDDDYQNVKSSKHSHRVLVKEIVVLLECYIHTNGNMKLAQDRLIADMEQYFMTYPFAPDAKDPSKHWARECMFRRARPFGLETNKPNGGVDVEIVFFYGQDMHNYRIPA